MGVKDEDDQDFDVDMDGQDTGRDERDDVDDDEDGEGEQTAEQLKAELARTKRALQKANREAARARHNGKNGTVKKTGTAASGQADEEDDKSGEVEQWKSRAIRSDAKAALLGAGFTGSPKAAARLIRAIDVAELEFEDDEIIGLDEQIEDLKADFPNLFKDVDDEEPPVRRVRTDPPGRSARDGRTGGRKPLTASEHQAQVLMGIRR